MGFIGNRKFNKPQGLNIQVYLPDDADQSLIDDVCEVLGSTLFHKISVPVYVYNRNIDSSVEADDTRVRVAGYIKKYDKDEGKFLVHVFPYLRDQVTGIGRLCIQPQLIINRNGQLATITRLVITAIPQPKQQPISTPVEQEPTSMEAEPVAPATEATVDI